MLKVIFQYLWVYGIVIGMEWTMSQHISFRYTDELAQVKVISKKHIKDRIGEDGSETYQKDKKDKETIRSRPPEREKAPCR
jgi:hypothetical protein